MKLRFYSALYSCADRALAFLLWCERHVNRLRVALWTRCTIANLAECNSRAARREILS